MKKTTFLALMAVSFVPAAVAAVDLSALAIRFEADGDALAVEATYGVWHDVKQGDYTIDVTLTQIRNGSPIATLWQDSRSGLISETGSTCRRGCHVQSCTGSCNVGGKDGACKVMITNCDGKDGYTECLCAIKSALLRPENVVDGDVFRLSVTPTGATDVDPANNVLTVAFH